MLKQQGKPERVLKIGNSQKGFTEGKFCFTSPNSFSGEMLDSVASGEQWMFASNLAKLLTYSCRIPTQLHQGDEDRMRGSG